MQPQDFRQRTPVRRVTHSSQTEYTKFKPELREDFNERCGYCGDHDFFRTTYYEIDHFRPQKRFPEIAPNTYSNLVYSCRSCNNSKRKKWPTDDVNLPNDGHVGFVDPCDADYATYFKRGIDGSIVPISELGTWMWKNLNLGNPIHRVTWSLEQLRKNIISLQKLSESSSLNPDDAKSLLSIVGQYFSYEEQLKGVPHF